MAHLTTQRTTKGETRYVVRYRAPDGKERQRWFARRRDAERYRRTVEADLVRGVWIDPRSASVTFRAWASAWLAEPGKRPSAYARDETIVRVHLTPAFGDQPLGSITPADVRRLVVEWSGKYAPRTTKRHYGTLRAIMASAVATDMIGRSPCRGVRLPAAGDSASHVVDGGELERLATELGPRTHRWRTSARCSAFVGASARDCASARRLPAIDADRRRADHARRAGVHVSGPPKSHAGRRTLAIPTAARRCSPSILGDAGSPATDTDALSSGAHGGPLRYEHWRRRVWLPATRERVSTASRSTTCAGPTRPRSCSTASISRPRRPASVTPIRGSRSRSTRRRRPRPIAPRPTRSGADSSTRAP